MSFTSTAESAPARSRLATRERLLAAGVACFAERGLHRTTTVQIARRAGVAVGTFYLHFDDKQALFRTIVLDAFERLRARLREASARGGDDPRTRIRERAESFVGFAEENREVFRLLLGPDHEAAEIEEDLLDALTPELEAGLRRRAAEGRVHPGLHPAVAARALAVLWPELIRWWLEDPSRAPRAAFVETLVRLHPFANPPAPGAQEEP